MSYVHPDDRNLTNLHKSMDYNESGQPIVRTRVDNTWNDPVPVTLGSNTITITGDVVIPATVNVASSPDNPVHVHATEVGTSGILNVPWMPVAGNVRVDSGNIWINGGQVTASQGTNPWLVSGNVNVLGIPEVEIKNDAGNAIPVTGNVYLSGIGVVNYGDGADKTAFSRLRVASSRLMGEFRNKYGTTGLIEMINKTVGGGNVTANLSATYTTLSVTTANNDRAVRQSKQYHPYIPGTSTIGMMTFCFDPPAVNLQQSVGLYDDNNGIFLRMNGTTPELVIRKGGIDEEVHSQSQWNVDTFLPGTNTGGIVLDFTKAQILVIDYQWLGVGRVRVGFDVNGMIYYAHYFNHANSVTEPYTYEPSLPVRWEIRNVGSIASPASMKAICYSVYCEGEDKETGFSNSVSNGLTPVTVNASTAFGILAVRLKNSVNGIPMKALARLKNWNLLTNNDVFYKVLILPGSSSLVGSPSWTDCTPVGWCEYTTNFTLTADPGANSLVLYSGYANGNQGNSSGANPNLGTDMRTATIYQNYDSTDSMIFAIVAYKITNNATVYGSMDWIEVK